MAIRNIRKIGDPVLNKVCKEVREVNDRTRELIDDMFETMYESDGVGLAAPQVGVLKRIVVIDVTGEDPILLINPVILSTDVVTRPNHVKVKAYNMDMEEFTLEGEELLARAICHELDHLDGKLYVDCVEGELMNTEDLNEE